MRPPSRLRVTLLSLFCLSILSPDAPAAPDLTSAAEGAAESSPRRIRYGETTVLWSTAHGAAKAAGDTVAIFGGPGSLEGRFQTPDGNPDTQGWIGDDRTDTRDIQPWHVSTFNAANLDESTTPNHAMWCGFEDGAGWVVTPGYGNGWDESLDFHWTVPDPSQASTVRLEMVFNHSVEPGFDFFDVCVDSAVFRKRLDSYTGYNAPEWSNPPPPPEAVVYDRTWVMPANSYVGDEGDDLHIYLRVTSDGAWSDQDGLWPSFWGAAQVDRIRVTVNGIEVSYADFEGSPGDDDWASDGHDVFYGDFFKILPRVTDLDPCVENPTPVAAFVDDGTPPSNAPGLSTGGEYSNNYSPLYGGSAVVNYSGGISFDSTVLADNGAVSPVIPWNDPHTTADDDLDSGAFLRFDVYQHQPVLAGIFWRWQVRSQDANGEWSLWKDRNFVYEGGPHWATAQKDVRDLLVADPMAVQIRLGVLDFSAFYGFPGNDATPAPYFDNVSFYRYQHVGPQIGVERFQLFHDSFPASGSLDPGGDLLELSVRIDTPSRLGLSNTPGDSLVANVQATVPGTELAGPPRLLWALEAHPLYDGVRQLPPGAMLAGTTAEGRAIWTGSAAGVPSRNSVGDPIENLWAFDLPDGHPRPNVPGEGNEPAMFFAGDVLRYALVADDTGGGSSSLPADLSGLTTGVDYDPRFVVRALPSLSDDGSTQPSILVWVPAGMDYLFPALGRYTPSSPPPAWDSGSHHELVRALTENGLVPAVDFDFYLSDSRFGEEGLGAPSFFGASLAQADGYGTILVSGENQSQVISSGDDGWGGVGPFTPDDAAFLGDWSELTGPRNLIVFGDRLGEIVNWNTSSEVFLREVLGVQYGPGELELSEYADGLLDFTVEVVPGAVSENSLLPSFTVLGGCPELRQFLTTAEYGGALPVGSTLERTHRFVRRDGSVIPEGFAGLRFDRLVDGETKTAWSFPFDIATVVHSEPSPATKLVDGRTARAIFLADLFDQLGLGLSGSVTGANAPSPFQVHSPAPNPFNPSTNIQLVAPFAGHVAARVYDLRGRRVATLHDGELSAGTHVLRWSGVDQSGASVASGVYVLVVEGFGREVRSKLALVK